ncbi:MAG: radical SAM protein [Planctomycetota bacterium]
MKVLLSSVFGPYGVDDAYGRKENIMELFHNQITREQGIFSLRFHHPSFGLYFIAENIRVPTAVLDFPSEKKFIKEIRKGYDYVGISFIVPNFVKAKRMAELIREHAPRSKIVLGGHGTSIPGLEGMIEHDFLCRGEGVKWFRRLLNEEVDRPFKHPIMPTAVGRRILGTPLKSDTGILIPGVGCTNACRFCCTSHFFDKQYTSYFKTGKELFDLCLETEKTLGFNDFGIMDENFLKQPERAMELLQLMEEHDKHFLFSIFSSAETIAKVGVEFLARLGVNFLWIGVESKYDMYEKNKGIDLKAMIRDLRDHGITVLASGILFLEQHDKETIWDDIRFLVDLESDLVQFMQLSPMPGTGLYRDYDEKGILKKEVPFEEWHGQHRIWFDHPHFTPEESKRILKEAFRYDYDTQGSSLLRMSDTAIRGYMNLAKYKDPYMVKRRELIKRWAGFYRPALDVLKRCAHNDSTRSLTEEVIAKYEKELGPKSFKLKMRTHAVTAFAFREAARVAFGKNVYQPRIKRTRYRMSARDLVAERLRGKNIANLLNLDINWSQVPVVVKLEGIMDKVNASALARKIKGYLKNHRGEVILSIDRLDAIEDKALKRFLKKIKRYHGRAKIVFSEETSIIREALARLPDRLSWLFVQREWAPVCIEPESRFGSR